MKNPLEQAIQSGVRANERVGELFARLGTGEHSRGIVPSAYRNARRELTDVLKLPNNYQAATDILSRTRQELSFGLTELSQASVAFGLEEAGRQLGFYDITATDPINLFIQSQSATEAILARFDAQAATIYSLLLSGADEALIIGDEDRVGALRPGDILAAGAVWLAILVWLAWHETITSSAPDRGFQKQVIAALDNRTTDCCLNVHGQVQPLDGKFNLTGTPRFADEMEWTPFHGYCRSAVVLYLPEFDAGFTDRMQAAARQIIAEREAGVWKDRHPADAYG